MYNQSACIIHVAMSMYYTQLDMNSLDKLSHLTAAQYHDIG